MRIIWSPYFASSIFDFKLDFQLFGTDFDTLHFVKNILLLQIALIIANFLQIPQKFCIHTEKALIYDISRL